MKNPVLNNAISIVFTTILLVIVSSIIFSFIGITLFGLFYNIHVFANPSLFLSADYTNPDVIVFLKYIQIFQSIGMFVVPPIIIVYLSRNNVFASLAVDIYPKLFILVIAGIIMITAMPLIDFMSTINSKMIFPESLSWLEQWMKQSEENASVITKVFLNTSGISGLLVNLLMIAVIPAFGEELMFRGFIQKYLTKRMNVHLAIFVSAFIFSAIHFQFYGFLPRFMMGLFFGYLLLWSGSLWLPIFAHFINNGAAVVITYIYGVENMSSESLVDNASNYNYLVIISLFLTSSLIFIIYRYYSFYQKEKKIQIL
jgi:membrane protease YdiL (CAAX protease family)